MFPKRLAAIDTTCLRVELSKSGSFDCWLVVKPRFKVHSLGVRGCAATPRVHPYVRSETARSKHRWLS